MARSCHGVTPKVHPTAFVSELPYVGGFLVLVGLLAVLSACTTDSAPPSSPTSSSEQLLLEVLEFNCIKEAMPMLYEHHGIEGYAFIDGLVRNISDDPLDHVIAVARWYAADGTFLSRDIAFLSRDALTPGQVYPFRTVARYQSEMETCRLSFKQMMGGAITARYPDNETDRKRIF